MGPNAELLYPLSLNTSGTIFHKGVKTPVSQELARALNGDERFKVHGLDAREAVEDSAIAGRPMGDTLMEAIREAADGLDTDDDDNFDRGGKPSHHAIGMALGYEVTLAERDKALTPPLRSVERLDTAGKIENTDVVLHKAGLSLKPRVSDNQKDAIRAASAAKDATITGVAKTARDSSTDGGVAS
jgi:hypothetical protein